MKNKNLTALMCCFIRGYHYKNNEYRAFSYNLALKILEEDEYRTIYQSIKNGVKFFSKDIIDNSQNNIKTIINKYLSPTILGRDAFCEKKLKNAYMMGCRQYLIYASGYDTSAYRHHNMKVFEIDREEIINDKIRRLKNSNIDFSNVNYISGNFSNNRCFKKIRKSSYDKDALSFNSLLGISYYLEKKDFIKLVENIASIMCDGSSLVFDYPNYFNDSVGDLTENLASGADSAMKAKYTYEEIEEILTSNNLLIYEHLNNNDITNNYFIRYNTLNPNNKIIAPRSVSYCLAVKKS